MTWQILVPVLFLGYAIGSMIEKRHFKRISKREKKFQNFPLHSGKKIPAGASHCFLVSKSVVISSDFFKRFYGSLRGVFGGNLAVYESLLDRARREATLRLKEQALTQGAKGIVHFRLETLNLSGEGDRGNMKLAQVVAYGTAYS
jgi:uncharacterized protein YbjQ (UPF0145 family)